MPFRAGQPHGMMRPSPSRVPIMPWSFACTYPGISSVYSLTYTASIGITPGVASILCHPADTPAAGGTLAFSVTDGTTTNTITLANCLLDQAAGEADASRRVLPIRLYDRRWTWADRYTLSGFYCQQDQHKKLVPATARSPFQLAILCLKAMGEAYPAAGGATVGGGHVTAITVYDGGAKYTSPPAVTLTGGGGTGATATATISGGVVTSVAVGSAGAGYTSPPTVTFGVPAAFSVDLPGGLAAPPSATNPAQPGPLDLLVDGVGDFLKIGVNTTRSRTNPVTAWTVTPAAVALAQMIEQYGRAVVFDPIGDAVSVQKLGSGVGLPAGRLLSDSPSVSLQATPQSVTALGAPTRFQVRLRFRAVGKDWDGSWRPLSELSYAPILPAGQAMSVTARVTTLDLVADYTTVVNGVTFTAAAGSFATANGIVTALATAINASADTRIAGKVTASAIGSNLFVTAVAQGYEFKIRCTPTADWLLRVPVGPIPPAVAKLNEWEVLFDNKGVWTGSDTLSITVNGTPYLSAAGLSFDEAVASVADQITNASAVASATAAGGGFVYLAALTTGVTLTVSATISFGKVTVTETTPGTTVQYGFHRSFPGSNPDVRLNGRRTYEQTRDLAKSTVFSCYQLVLEDPANPDNKYIPVATLANVLNRFLIQLTDSRVEQVVPHPGDKTVVDPRTGQPFSADLYSGYSLDRRPTTFASVNAACITALHYPINGGIGPNTSENQEVYIPFDVIDYERQVVRFERPLYRLLGEGNAMVYLPAEPVIEIGVIVADPNTFAPLRYGVTVTVGGATAPPVTRVFEDIRQEIIGRYDSDHKLQDHSVNDLDPQFRGTTYATEVALGYQNPNAEKAVYNNMTPVVLSGLVRQVEWSFSASGFRTSASANSEFSTVIPSYGERRRAENLPPDKQRAMENVFSNPALRELPANLAKAVGRAMGGIGFLLLLLLLWFFGG